MRLIAISGKRGAGKDTAARIIRDILAPEYNWETLRFAAPLKAVAAELTGERLAVMHSQRGKAKYLPDWGMTVGEVQQQLGEKICEVNPRAWISPLLRELKPYGSYLVPDVRKPIEADALRKAGALVIRINGNPAGQQGNGTRDDGHITETGLDDYFFDAVIDNDGDLQELEAKLWYVLFATNVL